MKHKKAQSHKSFYDQALEIVECGAKDCPRDIRCKDCIIEYYYNKFSLCLRSQIPEHLALAKKYLAIESLKDVVNG